MALSPVKTWLAGETLSANDLNAEFNNILTNGGGSLSSPRTANFDLDGYRCTLDGAGGAWMIASTTNILDFYGASTLLYRLDMSVASPVNALSFEASATLSDTNIRARGSDTDISINLIPKGAGSVKINGVAITTAASADDAQNIIPNLVYGG